MEDIKKDAPKSAEIQFHNITPELPEQGLIMNKITGYVTLFNPESSLVFKFENLAELMAFTQTAFMTSTKQLNAQIVIDKGEGGYEYK